MQIVIFKNNYHAMRKSSNKKNRKMFIMRKNFIKKCKKVNN